MTDFMICARFAKMRRKMGYLFNSGGNGKIISQTIT